MLEWDFEETQHSSVQILYCEQNTDEWLEARRGIPTASMFHAIMANGDGATRMNYMYDLAGERITGELSDNIRNRHTERGHVMEADARNLYSLLMNKEPELVGFVRNGKVGCSPDSLVDDNGLLEIKSKMPRILIPVLIKGELPSEHKAQVQGQIWVTERDWCDFVAYWPKMPPFIHRVYRDDAYIKLLAQSVDKFNDELDMLESQLLSMQ